MQAATATETISLEELTPVNRFVKDGSYPVIYYIKKDNSWLEPLSKITIEVKWLNRISTEYPGSELMHSIVPLWRKEDGSYFYASEQCQVPIPLPVPTPVHDCFGKSNSPFIVIHLVNGKAFILNKDINKFVLLGGGGFSKNSPAREGIFQGFYQHEENSSDGEYRTVTIGGTKIDILKVKRLFEKLSIKQWESTMFIRRKDKATTIPVDTDVEKI
jgi:hypothetical protein